MAAPSRRAVLTVLGSAMLIALALALHARQAPLPDAHTLFPGGELRIGVEAARPPYASEQDGELVGLAIDLGQELGRELGLPAHFVPVSHDGRLDALRLGHVDLLVAINAGLAAREADVRATRPWFDAGLVLVSGASQPVNTMAELAGRSLALALGSGADLEARRWQRRVAPFEIMAYELPDYALDAVRLGVAHAALVDTLDARLHIRQFDWHGQLRPVRERHVALALPTDAVARWQVVDRALGDLLERGAVARLLDEWL